MVISNLVLSGLREFCPLHNNRVCIVEIGSSNGLNDFTFQLWHRTIASRLEHTICTNRCSIEGAQGVSQSKEAQKEWCSTVMIDMQDEPIFCLRWCLKLCALYFSVSVSRVEPRWVLPEGGQIGLLSDRCSTSA